MHNLQHAWELQKGEHVPKIGDMHDLSHWAALSEAFDQEAERTDRKSA